VLGRSPIVEHNTPGGSPFMQHRAATTFARLGFAGCIAQGVVCAAFASAVSAQEPAAPAGVSAAQAAPTSDTPHESAPHFQLGLDALAEGRDLEAANEFRAAFDRDKNPAALVNLGIALTNLSRPHGAVQALEEYLAHADTLRDAATMQAVTQEIARLRKSSGRIGLHLVPQHAQVELDGEPVKVERGELLASPGRHTISAHADGYAPFSQSLDVVAGQFTLEITLVSLSIANIAAATPTEPQPPVGSTSSNVAAAEPADADTEEAGSSCALKQVCVGPVLSLFGPPNLVGGGVHARFGQYLGVGVDYQVLPTLNFNPISVGASLVSANARVYPFGGAFFLSGGVGYQSFRGQIRDGDITISARTSFPALMASLGFMGRSGFILGADLGLMFPLGTLRAKVQDDNSALAESGIPQGDIDAARTEAESMANKALNKLPLLVQVNLLRVGYMF
jgi:hypothetical protein